MDAISYAVRPDPVKFQTSLSKSIPVTLPFIDLQRHFGGNRGPQLDAAAIFFHGLTTAIPQPAKSSTFRVATAAPRERAMAAIWASASAIGRPARRRVAAFPAGFHIATRNIVL